MSGRRRLTFCGAGGASVVIASAIYHAGQARPALMPRIYPSELLWAATMLSGGKHRTSNIQRSTSNDPEIRNSEGERARPGRSFPRPRGKPCVARKCFKLGVDTTSSEARNARRVPLRPWRACSPNFGFRDERFDVRRSMLVVRRSGCGFGVLRKIQVNCTERCRDWCWLDQALNADCFLNAWRSAR